MATYLPQRLNSIFLEKKTFLDIQDFSLWGKYNWTFLYEFRALWAALVTASLCSSASSSKTVVEIVEWHRHNQRQLLSCWRNAVQSSSSFVCCCAGCSWGWTLTVLLVDTLLRFLSQSRSWFFLALLLSLFNSAAKLLTLQTESKFEEFSDLHSIMWYVLLVFEILISLHILMMSSYIFL